MVTGPQFSQQSCGFHRTTARWHLGLDVGDVLATSGPSRLATNATSDGSAHGDNPLLG